MAAAPEAVIFGKNAPRLCSTTGFAIPGLSAPTALMAMDLDGVMMSGGSTCSSGKVLASPVLAAMGVDEALAACALRASFGWSSTMEDVNAAVASLVKLRERVRAKEAA
jgi:cysteine desulfurase